MKVEGITCDKPVETVPKKELWSETIEVWDYLVESGYSPSDFSKFGTNSSVVVSAKAVDYSIKGSATPSSLI